MTRLLEKLQRSLSHEMRSYSSLNPLLPSEDTPIQSFSNGVSLEEGKQASSSLLRDTGQPSSSRSKEAISSSSKGCLLLTVLVIFLFVTLSFAIACFLYYQTLPCTSEECVMTASRLLKRVDQSVEPCDNFYQFACGGWINQSVNLKYDSWNTLYETQRTAHDQIVQAMHKINDGSYPLPTNAGERAAAKMYEQCMDTDTLEQTGLHLWERFVDELGGWMPELKNGALEQEESFEIELDEDEKKRRRFEIEDIILSAFNYSVFPLFWAGVEVNYLNSKEHLITIYEQLPILLAPEKYHYNKELTPEMIYGKMEGPPVTRALQQVGEELSAVLGFDSTDEKVRMMIANMIYLEYQITMAGSTFYKEKKERYTVVMLRELQEIAPAINWHYFLSRLVGENLSHSEPIALKTGTQWIPILSAIVEKLKQSRSGVAVLKNYVKWKTIMFHLAYASPKCRDGLLWMAVSLYSGAASQRKEFCVLRLSGIFPLSLPSILRKIDGIDHTEKNVKAVQNIADRIQEKYEEMVRSSNLFSDRETRENVIDKVNNMTKFIGFPDAMRSDYEMEKEAVRLHDTLFWSMVLGSSSVYKERLQRLRLPVDPRSWVDTRPAISVPAHNYERNLVQIPFDSLRLPYADEHQLDFANYAGIGTIIGHELTHAFDGQGKLHGPTGNLGVWWSTDSIREFKAREQCFVKQYAGLMDSHDMNAAKEGLYENIADQVGLKVAYEAWKSNGNQNSGRMPGLEKYSQDQLFFLAYTQGWCALRSKSYKLQPHMEERIRMLGSLQNSPEFASAWKCSSESFMNPPDKCSIW
ncbi:Neprilysin [Caenorhabditis elegans]|uniref:Neprilysin n=1 Tax=Caenorhabditis elegans TaxID=6239 RepID=G5ED52_CAEEL|nr:Neprilysin [Caenorhabditis elegans]CAE48845.1 Neprilysin [Caenorhabditis elegans]|eukprot:NP_001022540.1 NEPrilysin metallopeptidase family [Caenorhabditis elegans]